MSDAAKPSLRLLAREPLALVSRAWRMFGSLSPRGPLGGQRVMVIPGFLATDRTTLGLQRALGAAGFRVIGWGMGLNKGVRADTLHKITKRLAEFAGGGKVVLVGWSLGGLYAREVAKLRPDLVERVVTLGSPFSGDPRANHAWRLYEAVAGHKVDAPPIAADVSAKPAVETIALWSAGDGIVAPASARGALDESDRQVEVKCSHMGFAVSPKAWPAVVRAVRGE